jgi:hypothetical protein
MGFWNKVGGAALVGLAIYAAKGNSKRHQSPKRSLESLS